MHSYYIVCYYFNCSLSTARVLHKTLVYHTRQVYRIILKKWQPIVNVCRIKAKDILRFAKSKSGVLKVKSFTLCLTSTNHCLATLFMESGLDGIEIQSCQSYVSQDKYDAYMRNMQIISDTKEQ